MGSFKEILEEHPMCAGCAMTLFIRLAIIADLSEAQRRELKVKGGVRVETADAAAGRAGIREGDVILSLDNTEITGAKQFESVVAKVDKTKPVNVLVRRGEWVNYVVIRPAR